MSQVVAARDRGGQLFPIAQALRDISYQGTVGLEAWASSDSELALERFQAAFKLAR
jgi:hydroxypyruvate isomerase